MTKDSKISEELKELILQRIGIMPPEFKLSIGGKGTFTKQELMDNIQRESDIGREVVNMQLNFIKAMTSGKLINTLNQNE